MEKEYISEQAWSKILKFLKNCSGIYVGLESNCKKFIEAIYWISRTGAQWRELHDRYGNWNSVFKRFNSWSKKNIWNKLLQFCIEDPDLEYVMIDATIVRAHACSAGYGNQAEQGLGRSAGGFTSKIHAKVDALGNPLQFIITPGQTSDVTQAEKLLENTFDSYVLADRAYGSLKVREQIKSQQSIAVIPYKKNSVNPIDHDNRTYA